jgi:hypothetical protein
LRIPHIKQAAAERASSIERQIAEANWEIPAPGYLSRTTFRKTSRHFSIGRSAAR